MEERDRLRVLFKRYLPRWAPFFLRLALGTVFMAHGWIKLTGPVGSPQGFNIDSWGWPFPAFWAWSVALIETFGGLLIVVGLYTRMVAALIAIEMLVAIYKVKAASGFVGGFEFEFSLLMMALALTFAGAGRFSVDLDILGRPVVPRRRKPQKVEETAEEPEAASAD